MRLVCSLCVVLLFAALAAAAAVQVRVEKVTYPVVRGTKERPNWSPLHAAKLQGVTTYTTDAVVLENEYLRLTVLPELGGRLVHAVFKPTNREMFWVNDNITDDVSWSMGGCRWSFPFWEHGRHFDETGGYTVVRQQDGSVTLAVDMRFEDFLTPGETKRYGRATNLRLAQYLHLAPNSAVFTWTGRVDNPLPIPYGFKLWYLMRQPAVDGAHVILPAAAITTHGGPSLQPWDRNTVIHDITTSVFAIGIDHDFAGWYFPGRDLNVLRVGDHRTAPGAKQVLYPPDRSYVEMWGGNHELFEECGRMLPAFGGYRIAVQVLAAEGIGAADYANERAAVACSRGEQGWRVGIAPTRPLRGVTLTLTGDGKAWTQRNLAISPEKPFTATVANTAGKVRLTATDAAGTVLVDQTFPIEVGPMPEQEFAAVQQRVAGTMPGGRGLYAEAYDLVTETQYSLVRAAGDQAKILKESDDVPALLDAARRLLRVRKDDADVLAGLEKVLAKEPGNAQANLLKGMWLLEARRAAEALPCLEQARSLPGGRWLLALCAVARKDYSAAEQHLNALLALPAAASFRGADDPAFQLLQVGAFTANTQPRLLQAIVLEAMGKLAERTYLLQQLTADDPALIEAWMLLGEHDRVKTLTAANPSGLRVATETLAALRAGAWRGIGRP